MMLGIAVLAYSLLAIAGPPANASKVSLDGNFSRIPAKIVGNSTDEPIQGQRSENMTTFTTKTEGTLDENPKDEAKSLDDINETQVNPENLTEMSKAETPKPTSTLGPTITATVAPETPAPIDTSIENLATTISNAPSPSIEPPTEEEFMEFNETLEPLPSKSPKIFRNEKDPEPTIEYIEDITELPKIKEEPSKKNTSEEVINQTDPQKTEINETEVATEDEEDPYFELEDESDSQLSEMDKIIEDEDALDAEMEEDLPDDEDATKGEPLDEQEVPKIQEDIADVETEEKGEKLPRKDDQITVTKPERKIDNKDDDSPFKTVDERGRNIEIESGEDSIVPKKRIKKEYRGDNDQFPIRIKGRNNLPNTRSIVREREYPIEEEIGEEEFRYQPKARKVNSLEHEDLGQNFIPMATHKEVQLESCPGPNTVRAATGECLCSKGFPFGNPLDVYGCWACAAGCAENAVCTFPGVCTCKDGFIGNGSVQCSVVLPHIRSISPPSGTCKGGTKVNISYSYRTSKNLTIAICSFGGIPVEAQSFTDSNVVCVSPARSSQKASVAISFDGTHWSQEETIFTYEEDKSMLPALQIAICGAALIGVIAYAIAERKGRKERDQERIPFITNSEVRKPALDSRLPVRRRWLAN